MCFPLLRCSKSLRSIFDKKAASDNRKNSIHDQLYLKRKERSCTDVFCDFVGEDDFIAHNLLRLRSTILMRRLVIDEASGNYSFGGGC